MARGGRRGGGRRRGARALVLVLSAILLFAGLANHNHVAIGCAVLAIIADVLV